MVVEDRRLTYHDVRGRWDRAPAPVWGETDCACFVLDVISKLQDRDARVVLGLPSWTCRREAAAAILSISPDGSLDGAVREGARRLGLRKVYSLMAQPGDLCLIHVAAEEGDHAGTVIVAPGIIDPHRTQAAVFRATRQPGLVGVRQRDVQMAWRVE